MHSDDAYEFLIGRLASIPDLPDTEARNRRTYGCDLWIPDTTFAYWRPQLKNVNSPSELEDGRFQPFYDAAWDLVRIGVLRPGPFAPKGADTGGGTRLGDGFSITVFGRSWLREAGKRPTVDVSRLSEVLQAFATRFGDGYAQRATEAVRTYRTCNYLAACAMSGAAAESILLALAIKKTGDEAKVLEDYKAKSGRREITKRVVHGVSSGVAGQFETALQVLHFWRDVAAHGTMTTISEIEAYASINSLLRLAQFASDQWVRLTS